MGLRALRECCARYAPAHVYMSVLDWLFPERVGRKEEAKYAYPVGGEYVVDVDAYMLRGLERHEHSGRGVCAGCLETSRRYAIQLCEAIEESYSDVVVVFSGRRGFHVHALDFSARDWARYDARDPVRSHEVARFRYTLYLSRQVGTVFDRPHFVLSVDPMRVVSVPQTLNGSTGLVCTYVGGRGDLERCDVVRILEMSSPALTIWPLAVTPEPRCISAAVISRAKNGPSEDGVTR
jgi:hypothetical protein